MKLTSHLHPFFVPREGNLGQGMGQGNLGFTPKVWYSLESPRRFDFESPSGRFEFSPSGRFEFFNISRDIPRELYAPIKNNEKWREHNKSVWIFYGVFEAVSLKILRKKVLKRRQNYSSLFTSCHLAKNFGKMVYLSKKQSVVFSKVC